MDLPLLLTVLCGVDGVLPMIPSEAAVLAAGVFAEANVVTVVLAAALGVFIGDHLAYGLARSVVGPRIISRSKKARRAVATMAGPRAGLLIVSSRFLPGGRVTANLAAGTARLPLRRFSPASAVAALAWATYTVGLGYAGGAAFADNPILAVAVGLALSFVLGAVAEMLRRRGSSRRGSAAANGSSRRERPRRTDQPACSVGRTSSSLTATCRGRVTMYSTVSAMSSA